jgi:hypothetical protein
VAPGAFWSCSAGASDCSGSASPQRPDTVRRRCSGSAGSLIEALHVVEGLLRSPEALAGLLEAAEQVALERVGAILDERVPESAA